MNDRDWEKFFELVDRIVEGRGLTANEKAVLVRDKCKEQGERAEMNFEEFTAWDFGFEDAI